MNSSRSVATRRIPGATLLYVSCEASRVHLRSAQASHGSPFGNFLYHGAKPSNLNHIAWNSWGCTLNPELPSSLLRPTASGLLKKLIPRRIRGLGFRTRSSKNFE